MPGDVGREALEFHPAVVQERGETAGGGSGKQVIEHLGKGLVRDAGIGVRGPDEHRHPVVAKRAGHLSRQARLAGPRFSADEHELAAAALDLGPDRLEGLELGAATDERQIP